MNKALTAKSRGTAPAANDRQFSVAWDFGQKVNIDDDQSIVGTVTGFCFRVTRDPTVEVSWFHNGDAKTGWFEEWRLSRSEK